MSKNITRDFGRLLQQGITDAKTWEWGPFMASRVEYRKGTGYGLLITFGPYALQISWTEAA